MSTKEHLSPSTTRSETPGDIKPLPIFNTPTYTPASEADNNTLTRATSALPPSNNCCRRAETCEKVQEEEEGGTRSDVEMITFPEGGLRAWLVVAGAMHVTFATFGFTNTWGVFQTYYSEEKFASTDASTIAWIGSLQYCLMFLPAVVMGRLLDIGKFQIPFNVAIVTYIVSVFLTAECKQYWQALLCQGLLLGAGAGTMFGPALAIVAHWFYKKRVLAYGVVACGSSIGGAMFPVLVRHLIDTLGFKWAVRICGFIILYACTFAFFTLKTRLPPKNASGGMFNLAAFKDIRFSTYVAACWFSMLGIYTPLTYVDTYGTAIGLGSYATSLISIANACSVIGRLLPALFARRLGPITLLIPFVVLAGASTFAWPFCKDKGSLTAFATINGMSVGAFVSLFTPGIAQLGNMDDIGRRMGVVNTCLATSAVIGPPISGAVLGATGNYLDVAAFAGTVTLLGGILFIIARRLILGKWVGVT